MHNDSIFDKSYIKHTCIKPCIHSYVCEPCGPSVEQLHMKTVPIDHLTISVPSFTCLFCSTS